MRCSLSGRSVNTLWSTWVKSSSYSSLRPNPRKWEVGQVTQHCTSFKWTQIQNSELNSHSYSQLYYIEFWCYILSACNTCINSWIIYFFFEKATKTRKKWVLYWKSLWILWWKCWWMFLSCKCMWTYFKVSFKSCINECVLIMRPCSY